MHIYVSDVLESILDASGCREVLKEQCKVILQDLQPPARLRLEKPLEFVAGKCMAYPAVWFISRAFLLDLEETKALVAKNPGAIYISLTTSIADDFLDREPGIAEEHMMLLYLFIFQALREPHWFERDVLAQYQNSVYPVVSWFLEEGAPLSGGEPVVQSQAPGVAPGRRIGAFFETIARCLLWREVDRNHADFIVKCCGRFGEWCSDLDDIVDIIDDITSGAVRTEPIRMLAEYSTKAHDAILAKDITYCRYIVSTHGFMDALIGYQLSKLRLLRADIAASGLTGLSAALLEIEDRLVTFFHSRWAQLKADN